MQIVTPNGFKHLVSVPKRLGDRFVIEKGDYVVIQSAAHGEKYHAEIIRVIDRDYERFYRMHNVWPREYDMWGHVERLTEKIDRAEAASWRENDLRIEAELEEDRQLKERQHEFIRNIGNMPIETDSTSSSDIKYEKKLRKRRQEKEEKRNFKKEVVDIKKKEYEEKKEKKQQRKEDKKKKLELKKELEQQKELKHKKKLANRKEHELIKQYDKVNQGTRPDGKPTAKSAPEHHKKLRIQENYVGRLRISKDTSSDSEPTATSAVEHEKKLGQQKNKKEHKEKYINELYSGQISDNVPPLSGSSEHNTTSAAERERKLQNQNNNKKISIDTISNDSGSDSDSDSGDSYAPSLSDSSEPKTAIAAEPRRKLRKKKNEPRKKNMMPSYDTVSSDSSTGTNTEIIKTKTELNSKNSKSCCSKACCRGNSAKYTKTIGIDPGRKDLIHRRDYIPPLQSQCTPRQIS